MSSGKRLPPTARKLRKAREDGDVAKSRGFTAACGLFAVLAGVAGLGPGYLNTLLRFASKTFVLHRDFHTNHVLLYLREAGCLGGLAVFPLLLFVLFVVVGAEVLQVGLQFSFKFAAFKLTRLSFFQGLKRMLGFRESSDSGALPLGLLREISKIAIYCTVLAGCAAAAGWHLRRLVAFGDYDSAEQVVAGGAHAILWLLLFLCSGGLVLGLVELVAARHQQRQRLRMDVEELKQELRETEGDPEIRMHRRRLYRELLQHGLVQSIRRARVLIVGEQGR